MLTRILRGTEPAPPDQINTTTRGPWVVNVLTIDPSVANGHLEATFGPDLGKVERTTALVEMAGALAGVNASFFTFTANPQFPGDPVGVGIFGGSLATGQVSLQATGRSSAALLDVAGQGCVNQRVQLIDEDGDQVAMRPGLFGVNGRFRLTADGDIVVPDGSGSFFDRNPRTIAGTTRDRRIILATIDGRRTTSVGTTMDETAAVADALGMHDAVNLDGGGSTSMSVRGDLVNQPSGSTERAVGDALVYIERS